MTTLIIGGGIAGISAAARLAPHGPVVLLEAEDALSYHASGRSAAMFLQDYGNATVRALNYASADYLLSTPNILKPRGVMMLAKPGQDAAFEAEFADFGMQEISMTEAQAKVPILNTQTCARAAFRADVYDLDTDLLIQGFLKIARNHGADIVTKARVDSLQFADGVWHVRAGDRDWSAETLVNAGGAWADHIAQMAGIAPIGLQPYRRSMARIPAPGGHDVGTWPFMDGVAEAWYAKPDAGKLIVSPSEEHPMEPHDAWADDMVLAEGLARYEEMVSEPVTRLENSWAGLRTFAPDRTLVIGRDPVQPSFVWLAGQGGYGFQTAAAASQLVGDIVTGATPQLDAAAVTALSPQRF